MYYAFIKLYVKTHVTVYNLAQKVMKFVFGGLFLFLITMLLDNKCCTTVKSVYFPFKCATFVRKCPMTVNTAASQLGGSWFSPYPPPWSLQVLSGYSGFPPQSKHVLLRLIGDPIK